MRHMTEKRVTGHWQNGRHGTKFIRGLTRKFSVELLFDPTVKFSDAKVTLESLLHTANILKATLE